VSLEVMSVLTTAEKAVGWQEEPFFAQRLLVEQC
jgi:hypothetical protein